MKFLEETNRILLVQLHPNVEDRIDCFQFSERVRLSTLNYGEAIATAEFVFTDYSSVVLDAAFVGIPIAYYQWDFEDFFKEQPYDSRLDYQAEGLGPVITHHQELIKFITSSQFNQPDVVYAARRKKFFEGVELGRINSTIIERMLKL